MPTPGRRWWRWLAAAVALVVLGMTGAAAWLAHRYPPERLAALLADEVHQLTGREFHLRGPLSIRLLPALAVVAQDLSLGNTPWGTRPEMLRVERASFEVALRPLLQGRLRITEIDIRGADLLLETDGRGRVNWLLTPPATGAAASPAPSPASASATGAGGDAVQLDRLLGSTLRLTYRDGLSGVARSAVVETLSLSAESDRDRLRATLALGASRWQVDGRIGRLTGLAGATDWPFELHATTDGVQVDARGEMALGARAGQVRSTLKATVTSAAPLAALAPAAARLPVPATVEARFERTPDALRVDPLALSLAGQALGGRIEVRTTGARPVIDAQLAAPSLDLARWIAPAPGAAAPAAGDAPSAARGGASSAARGSERPAAHAGAAPARPAAAPPPGGPLFGDTPLPFDALAELPALTLALRVDRLAWPDAPVVTGLQARVAGGPGRLSIEPLAFSAAGGHVDATLALQQAGRDAPQASVRITGRGLSLEALDALAHQGRRLHGGSAAVDVRLAMSGRTPRSLAASATGEVRLHATGTALAGGAAVLERNVLATVLGALLPRQGAAGPLNIQCAVVRLPLQQGVATIDRSIGVETDQLAVSASGRIDLRSQTLVLAFRPTVKKGLGLSPANFAQLVMLEGPITAPGVSIDAKGVVREAATLGAAWATGGLTLLAPRLLESPADGRACETALGRAASPTAVSPPPAPKPAGPLDSAIRHLFGR